MYRSSYYNSVSIMSTVVLLCINLAEFNDYSSVISELNACLPEKFKFERMAIYANTIVRLTKEEYSCEVR